MTANLADTKQSEGHVFCALDSILND